jgi:regulatory protein
VGSSPEILSLKKVSRRKEYLVRLADGSEIRALADDVVRLGLAPGTALDEEALAGLQSSRDYAAGMETALRLLKARPRSAREIVTALNRKRLIDEAMRRVLEDLKAAGHVDDRIFARLWIQEKAGRGDYGRRLIQRDLRNKGIEPGILDEELQRHYDTSSEAEVARELARKRLLRLGGLPDAKRRQRLYGYLLRRGFPPDAAAEAVRDAIDREDEESRP